MAGILCRTWDSRVPDITEWLHALSADCSSPHSIEATVDKYAMPNRPQRPEEFSLRPFVVFAGGFAAVSGGAALAFLLAVRKTKKTVAQDKKMPLHIRKNYNAKTLITSRAPTGAPIVWLGVKALGIATLIVTGSAYSTAKTFQYFTGVRTVSSTSQRRK